MTYFCDSHIHTDFSYDAMQDGSMATDRICEAAIAAGLDEIVLTDHFDAGGISEGIYPQYNAKAAYDAFLHAKDKYSGRLKVSFGIELGDAFQAPEMAKEFISAYPFDYILGSHHNQKGVPDYFFFKYEYMGMPQIEQMFSRSLDEISVMLDFEGINSLAHMTYMHRYLRVAGKDLDFSKFYEKIAEIYKKIIDKGIALELNVSTLRNGGDFTMPTFELMKFYRECGGELVTCGSDAHRAEQIGNPIREGYRLLSEAGFSHITVFDKRKPIMKKL